MFLRYLLSATLILNPLADALAQNSPGATAASTLRTSTYLRRSDAPDWIVEGLAARKAGDKKRAKELFEAAKIQLAAEKLPDKPPITYATHITDRLEQLIESVADAPSVVIPSANTGANMNPKAAVTNTAANTATGANAANSTNKAGAKNAADKKTAKNKNTADKNDPLDPSENNSTTNNLFGDTNSTTTTDEKEKTEGEESTGPIGPVVNPKGKFLIATGDSVVLKENVNDDVTVRSLLWFIAAGRMAKSAEAKTQLEIIRHDLGKDAADDINGYTGGMGGLGGYGGVEAGIIWEALSTMGFLEKSYAKENIVLMQAFDGASLDDLAWRYIRGTAGVGAGIGAAMKIWRDGKRAGPTVGQSDMGGDSKIQLGADAMFMMMNNAQVLFRIAALYNQDLDQQSKQLFTLIVLAIGVSVMKKTRAGTAGAFNVIGQQAKVTANVKTWGPYLKQFAKNWKEASRKSREAGDEFLEEAAEMVPDILAGGVDPTVDLPVGGNAGGTDPNAGPMIDDPTQPDPKNDPKNKPKKAPMPKVTKADRIARVVFWITSAAKGIAWGGSEALAVGMLSMYFFKSAYEEDVRVQNKAFMRMMKSPKGEAFLKLLIHSKHLDEGNIANYSLDTERDPQTAFILNFARAVGVCSDEDYAFLAKNPGAAETKTSHAREAVRAVRGKVNKETKEAFLLRVIKYSCPTNSTRQAFERLKREMQTFNAISERQVAYLRTSSLRDRIKMSQLLLQFMSMSNGGISEDEEMFFKDVSRKILGITSTFQLDYLNNFKGFIVESGGMIPDPTSVTGFAVSTHRKKMKAPFDYKKGPTPVGAPSDILAVDLDKDAENGTDALK